MAIVGGGGYTGALTFGFLQRACSLYETGVGRCRCLGATADTSIRLNRILSKHFCLAVADESFIKLTDLNSIDAIASRLEGWDALIVGNEWTVRKRPVTANTYERTPNDQTWEMYWDQSTPGTRGNSPVSGTTMAVEERNHDETADIQYGLLTNVLTAARTAGVKHVMALDDDQDGKSSILQLLQEIEIPYTCIQPRGNIISTPDYTYRKGVQGVLSIGPDVSSCNPIAIEDLTALCVQSLLTLDWNQSRCWQVSCLGPALADGKKSNPKRPDQEWCVNSHRLEQCLRRAGMQ